MSSVAGKQSLAALLVGSASIAALFVWYLTTRNKNKMVRGPSDKADGVKKENTSVANGAVKEKDQKKADEMKEVKIEKDDVKIVANDIVVPQSDIVVGPSGDAPSNDADKEKFASSSSSQPSSGGSRSVSEGDYELEEPAVRESAGELQLELEGETAAPFSWSEEMERSYLEEISQEKAARDANGESDEYDGAQSPGLASQNSEVSSQDSGRATGGVASSLSPLDDGGEPLPMYEFEIPNSLVGLIIGIKGKTIKELSQRTDVRMLIRAHHTPAKVDTHQICQVRGKRDQINRCLQMLRRRFPPARFPELNLQPVLPPPLPANVFDAFNAQPSWLTLPEGVSCEVVCSSLVDPGHAFLQQPTHPSYSSLSHLDMYMLRLYGSQATTIPELPKPCNTGLLCAAPVLGAWFRAVTVVYYAEQDEVLVRFVDYGGYTRLPRAELRQIRTDLMTLPFQATEVYLAHVQPVDGTWQWGEDATELFQKTCMGKVIEAHVVGFHVDDKIPFVELTATDGEKTVRVDRALMEAGFAKASDPSKMVRQLKKEAKEKEPVSSAVVAAASAANPAPVAVA